MQMLQAEKGKTQSSGDRVNHSETPPLLNYRCFEFSRLKTSTCSHSHFSSRSSAGQTAAHSLESRTAGRRERPPPPGLTRSLCPHFSAEKTGPRPGLRASPLGRALRSTPPRNRGCRRPETPASVPASVGGRPGGPGC